MLCTNAERNTRRNGKLGMGSILVFDELGQKSLYCFVDFSLIFEPFSTICYDDDEMNNELFDISTNPRTRRNSSFIFQTQWTVPIYVIHSCNLDWSE